jgi:hypothetical protein
VFSSFLKTSCPMTVVAARRRAEPAWNALRSAPAQKNFSEALATTSAHLLVDAGVVDGGAQLAQEVVVVAVGRRPVEDDDSDRAFSLEPHRHAGTSSCFRRERIIIRIWPQ